MLQDAAANEGAQGDEGNETVFYTDKHLYKNFIRLWHNKHDQDKGNNTYNNNEEQQSPNR
jgi:hypothetical protein